MAAVTRHFPPSIPARPPYISATHAISSIEAAMTTFSDREKGFENKFKHDQEANFKATARRNKLLGLWIAKEMGLTGDAAIMAAFEENARDLARVGGN